MGNRFRRLPSPAMAVAFVALLAALGGTAVALPGKNSVKADDIAKGAVNTTDIKNRTIRTADLNKTAIASLRGQRGPAGSTGATGATGAPGPFPDQLQSGKTLRGTYAIDFTAAAGGNTGRGSIPFIFTLASNPTPNLLAPGASATAACPGTVADPQAAPGNLCVYQGLRSNVSFDCIAELTSAGSLCGQSDRFGTGVFTQAAAAGRVENRGSWAVTAP